jgi:hypothetical protein
MAWNISTTSKRRLSAKLVGGVAISALFVLGTFAGSARADDDDRGEHHGYHHNWNGGYYNAPPVVYGSPYPYGYGYSGYYGTPYYYPPVVYGPGIGINLPGVSIGIR